MLKFKSSKTYVIGEVGLNHNGSLDIASKIIQMAKSCGCDAVKLQKRDVDQLMINKDLDLPLRDFPSLGKTIREVRTNLELSIDDLIYLKDLCYDLNIDFIITPFDVPSLKIILDIGVDAIKIASHNLTDVFLLEKIASINIPIILSTGMSSQTEIDLAVRLLTKSYSRTEDSNKLYILHCNSQYPVDEKYANMSYVKILNTLYPNFTIGFSDHQFGNTLAIIAIAFGAKILEKHITIDRTLEGFDQKMSFDYHLLNEYIYNIRLAEQALIPYDKDILPNELESFNKWRRSLVTSCDIKKGDILIKDMFTAKEPNDGLSPYQVYNLEGYKAVRNLKRDTKISLTDVE